MYRVSSTYLVIMPEIRPGLAQLGRLVDSPCTAFELQKDIS